MSNQTDSANNIPPSAPVTLSPNTLLHAGFPNATAASVSLASNLPLNPPNLNNPMTLPSPGNWGNGIPNLPGNLPPGFPNALHPIGLIGGPNPGLLAPGQPFPNLNGFPNVKQEKHDPAGLLEKLF